MKHPDADAAAAVSRHTERLLAISGVHGIGVGRGSDYGGTPDPCIVIYADESVVGKTLPVSLEGFAVYVVHTAGFSLQPGKAPQGE